VFENIIEQGAVSQLQNDIISKKFAPSMLFYGPSESGKGSAALELVRVLSCERDAAWKCGCSSCERHRYLQHDDLLVLGKRSFSAEIAACCSVFLRNPSNMSAKLLFFRSLRKLQIRFSPVLLEDDPKAVKLVSVLQSFDEKLNEFLLITGNTEKDTALEKLCGALVKDALNLETDGISTNIPVNQIRQAAWWCRFAPNGKKKILLIENAENMKEEARNSLLKLLEEPPSTVNIVLTAQRREAIIPTILSRLRPYRFLKRSMESEKEIIRRVFQDTVNESDKRTEGSLISAYIESFLPRNKEKLYPIAAWFVCSLARIAAVSLRKNAKSVSGIITAIGERYAPIAQETGLDRTVKSSSIVKTLLAQSGNFDDDSLSRFLKICLDLIASVSRETDDPECVKFNDMFKKYIGETVTAVDVLNQSTTLALEALVHKLRVNMV
jgi:DNA polymerase III subunit gamma/tau